MLIYSDGETYNTETNVIKLDYPEKFILVCENSKRLILRSYEDEDILVAEVSKD